MHDNEITDLLEYKIDELKNNLEGKDKILFENIIELIKKSKIKS